MAAPMRPSPINPIFIVNSLQSCPQLGALRRRHKLRADGIDDGGVDDVLDRFALRVSERPACHTECCLYLIRVTAAPERNADALIEHPAHGQMDHAPVKTALRELMELPPRLTIRVQSGLVEFGVD